MLKKLIGAIFVLTCLLMGTSMAETEGDWEYTVSGGSATVIGYSGSSAIVTVPETVGGCTVTAISGKLFDEWNKENLLVEVTLPSGLRSIGDNCLTCCRSLQHIHLAPGNTVFTEKDGVLFRGDTLVRFPGGRTGSYSVPSGTAMISKNAFFNARIGSVSLPDGLTTVGYQAFMRCYDLAACSLPSSLQNIDDYAFCMCSSLSALRLGPNVSKIGDDALRLCDSMTGLTLDSENPNFDLEDGLMYTADGDLIYCAPDKSGTLNVRKGTKTLSLQAVYRLPSGITGADLPEGLTKIGSGVFNGLSELKTIRIPSTVTEIGAYAFKDSGLESITLPEGLTKIRQGLFENCALLTEVTIPSNVTEIGWAAFFGSGLTSIDIPSSVKLIDTNAFQYCRKLKEAILHEGLESIWSEAFAGTALTKVHIPASVKEISTDAFDSAVLDVEAGSWAEKWAKENGIRHTVNGEEQEKRDGDYRYMVTDGAAVVIAYDGNDKNVAVPSSLSGYPVRGIGIGVFAGKTIESCTLPEGVTDIGDSAFASASLQRIELPSSLRNIGTAAFNSCRSLSEIRFPEGIASIGSTAFENCDALTSISLPDGLKGENIGAGAFRDCDNVTTVKLPSGLTYLPMQMCNSCANLRSVDLPDNANGYNCAFGNCPNLVITVGKNTTAHRYLDWVNEGGAWHVNYRFRGEECENHTWDEGEVLEATCLAEGQIIYTCTVCHETKTEKLPKAEHVTEERIYYDTGYGWGQKFPADYLRDPEHIDFFRRVLTEQEGTQILLETYCTVCETVLASEPLSFPRVPGDANADGAVDILDALLIMRSNDWRFDVSIDEASADVNGDGRADWEDAMLILQYDCGWNVTLE